MNRKVTVVGGAGNVGATVARAIADKELADVVVIDIAEQKAGGVALDRLHRVGWIGPGTWVALETAHDEKVQVKALEIENTSEIHSRRRMSSSSGWSWSWSWPSPWPGVRSSAMPHLGQSPGASLSTPGHMGQM